MAKPWKPSLTATSIVVLVGTGIAAAARLRARVGKRQKWAPAPAPTVGRGSESVRVVILGAGVGGSFAAMWLREVFGERLKLTVISDGPVGGRCQLIDMPDSDGTVRQYECGASIVSTMNEYFIDMMKKFGLERKKGIDVPSGIYDGNGEGFVFRDAFMQPFFVGNLVTTWRALCRYGVIALLRLKRNLIGKDLPDVQQIYRALQAGGTFKHPKDFLQACSVGSRDNCYDMTKQSALEWLSGPGQNVPHRISEELVEAGMRSNYGGQGLKQLHAFVGWVSIMGGLAFSCFGVLGGNVQVPKAAMEFAKATHIQGTAHEVTKKKDNKFDVVYDTSVGEAMKGPPRRGGSIWNRWDKIEADYVFVAHHLARSHLKFKNTGTATGADPSWGAMRRCCTHFLRGRLKSEPFGVKREAMVAGVMTIGDKMPFYSIGLQTPVDASKAETERILAGVFRGEKAVFKIFAPTELSAEQLAPFFLFDTDSLKVVDWYAYPEYSVPQDLPPFVLAPGLVYLNAIEGVASAMEMSAFSARNAVNLVKKWHAEGLNAELRCNEDTGGVSPGLIVAGVGAPVMLIAAAAALAMHRK